VEGPVSGGGNEKQQKNCSGKNEIPVLVRNALNLSLIMLCMLCAGQPYSQIGYFLIL